VMVNEHFETDNPWLRETHQRNQILTGLTGCDDRDIIIIEDLDEIDETYPQFVRNNIAYFEMLGFIDQK